MTKCSNIVIAVLKVLVISLLSAVVMSLVWDVLEWMRNFGEGLPLIPQLSEMQLASKLTTCTNPFMSLVESFINWYNVTFLGAARFGSALGLVMGGFYALGTLRQHVPAAKIASAVSIGALIGGRLALLITSNATVFLFGVMADALLFGTAVGVIASAPQLPPLPPAQPE
jgi:hypothetical protein